MNVLLVCQAGMSTTIMCKKIQEAAAKVNDHINIIAAGLESIPKSAENKDIVLLAPQVKYAAQNIRKEVDSSIPIMIISPEDYGLMKGDAVYKKMKKVLESKAGEKGQAQK